MFRNIEIEPDTERRKKFPDEWCDDDDCDNDEGWNKEWDDFDWESPREDDDEDDWVELDEWEMENL